MHPTLCRINGNGGGGLRWLRSFDCHSRRHTHTKLHATSVVPSARRLGISHKIDTYVRPSAGWVYCAVRASEYSIPRARDVLWKVEWMADAKFRSPHMWTADPREHTLNSHNKHIIASRDQLNRTMYAYMNNPVCGALWWWWWLAWQADKPVSQSLSFSLFLSVACAHLWFSDQCDFWT